MVFFATVVNRVHKRPPPVDVEGVANSLGLTVHYAWLDDGISGELVRLPSGDYQINVHADDPSTRQRFTIANEIGYYVYHRDLSDKGIDDNRAYRSTGEGRFHNRNIGPAQETQANRFAATLLMPNNMVADLRAAGFDRRGTAENSGFRNMPWQFDWASPIPNSLVGATGPHFGPGG